MKRRLEIEDFISDPEFIRWVRNPDKESTEYWLSVVSDNPEDKKTLSKAFHLIKSLKVTKKKPSENLRVELLDKIVKRINESKLKEEEKSKNRWSFPYLRFAAVFVLVVASIYFFTNKKNVDVPIEQPTVAFLKETPIGAKLQTKLPDGTNVWMNSLTSIRYEENEDVRLVTLTGEVYFDVKPDSLKPFIVKTNFLEVKALGTSFNVRSYLSDTNVQVALISGEVLTSLNNEDNNMVLSPGEMAIANKQNNTLSKGYFSSIEVIGWKDGVLVFKNASFEELKHKLENWYGVQIIADLDKVENWNINGQFKNKSLEMVLEHLSFTKNFSYRLENNKVYINKL